MEQVDLSHPITEDDIANFLLASPDFFERHAEVLAAVTLASPHGNRAVGLQQRQAEMLREKIKGLESRIVDMVGHAHDNAQLANKVEQLCCELLHVERAEELPQRLVGELAQRFDVPQIALRLWDVDPRFAQLPVAERVSEDAQAFVASLTAPYCGVNAGFPVLHWLPEPETVLSIALIPLRWPLSTPAEPLQSVEQDSAHDETAVGMADAVSSIAGDDFAVDDLIRREPTFEHRSEGVHGVAPMPHVPAAERPISGLLVLASSDAKRFHIDLGIDFLERLGDLCSAALSRLRPVGSAGTHPAD